MRTLESIKSEISSIGNLDIFGAKKEVNYLPEILNDDENIKYLTSGSMDGNTWLVVCTNKRVIFLDKGLIYGLRQVEIPLDKINSIAHKTGLILGEVHIWDGASKMQIQNCIKTTVKPFVDAVNAAIESSKSKSSSKSSSSSSSADQLEKLASLLEKGLITKQEFEAEKKKVLS